MALLTKILVRTGCRTCKARRLKCDETKPVCLRCQKSNFLCEGYSIFVSSTDANFKPRELINAPSGQSIQPIDSMCFFRTLQSLAELTEREHQAYDFCRQHTVHAIAGFYTTHFWTHTVLAASHNEPAILHAMLALSGAHRVYLEGQRAITQYPHNIMRMHYGKAIHHLQNRIAGTGHEDIHIILMVCLLLLTFDIIQGRYREGSVHLAHGRQILKNLHSSSPAEELVTLHLVPEPLSVMDELFYSFALMDLQSIYFDGSLQFKLVGDQSAENTSHSSMPPAFHSLDEAWRSLLLLSNETLHFTTSMMNDVTSASHSNLPHVDWQGHLLAKLRQWHDAFGNSPLRIPTSRSSPTNAIDRRSTALRLNHAYLTIAVRTGANIGDEMAYDSLMPEFSTVVDLCNELVEEMPSISFDARVIPPLYTACCACRAPDLRRRAIRILAQAGKEGHFDGKLMALVSQEKMLLEEQEAGYDYAASPSVPLSIDLETLIPRSARWAESWASFVSEDYTVLELTFKKHRHSNSEGMGVVHKKLVKLDQYSWI